jgi:hypothetical protein
MHIPLSERTANYSEDSTEPLTAVNGDEASTRVKVSRRLAGVEERMEEVEREVVMLLPLLPLEGKELRFSAQERPDQ